MKVSDMSHTELAEALKEQQLNGLDKQLKVLDSRLDELQPLIELRDRLQAARRAILNDRSVAQGGGRGISQSEVVNAMKSNGEMSVYEIAQALGASEAVIRGHLNRGKDERFRKAENNKWVLRDPETEGGDDDED